ncbi:MAG: hypothetical protein EBQ96_01495 [Proteobacteria bacterium]|nr:hypothetical protein [Pseudomonadota bacterium]
MPGKIPAAREAKKPAAAELDMRPHAVMARAAAEKAEAEQAAAAKKARDEAAAARRAVSPNPEDAAIAAAQVAATRAGKQAFVAR